MFFHYLVYDELCLVYGNFALKRPHQTLKLFFGFIEFSYLYSYRPTAKSPTRSATIYEQIIIFKGFLILQSVVPIIVGPGYFIFQLLGDIMAC